MHHLRITLLCLAQVGLSAIYLQCSLHRTLAASHSGGIYAVLACGEAAGRGEAAANGGEAADGSERGCWC
jgi:hypothetical protein